MFCLLAVGMEKVRGEESEGLESPSDTAGWDPIVINEILENVAYVGTRMFLSLCRSARINASTYV